MPVRDESGFLAGIEAGRAGAAGSVYDWLNEDKRNAVETIVEACAEARDPEDKDGSLPDLEHPCSGGSR